MFHIGTATGLYLYEINFIMVTVLFSFVRWSVRCSHKRGHGRGAGKQSLLFLQVLERWIDGQRVYFQTWTVLWTGTEERMNLDWK